MKSTISIEQRQNRTIRIIAFLVIIVVIIGLGFALFGPKPTEATSTNASQCVGTPMRSFEEGGTQVVINDSAIIATLYFDAVNGYIEIQVGDQPPARLNDTPLTDDRQIQLGFVISDEEGTVLGEVWVTGGRCGDGFYFQRPPEFKTQQA